MNQQNKAFIFVVGMTEIDFASGLRFMTPITNKVGTFDARVLTLDEKSKRFSYLLKKKNAINYTFANWRIGDGGLFYSIDHKSNFDAQ